MIISLLVGKVQTNSGLQTAEIPGAANIITDFTSGEDVLGIAGLGIGFDDLSISQQEDNTLIAANNSRISDIARNWCG